MITSRRNQKLKDMKRIRRCKGAPGEALLEGPHLISAALAAGLPVNSVVATPAFWDSEDAAALRRALPHPPELAAPEVLEELADADSPRGIVARTLLRLYRCPAPDVAPEATEAPNAWPAGRALARGPGNDVASSLERSDRLAASGAGLWPALPAQRGGVYVYLDRVQDPGNLGAIARVAEATGVAALVLSPDCAHPEHPRSLRASAGSLLRIAVAPSVELPALTRHLATLSPRVAVLEPRDGTELHRATADLEGTLILVLGSEGSGARPDIFDAADVRLTIPMESPVESLNVAVAAAVVLYERRRSSPITRPGPCAGRR